MGTDFKGHCPICNQLEAVVQEVAQEYNAAPMYQVVCMECCSAGPLCAIPSIAVSFWMRVRLAPRSEE